MAIHRWYTKLNCLHCYEGVHPKYAVFREELYLCYKCAKELPPDEYPPEVPGHSLVRLMMRRELGECVRKVTADVNRLTNRAEGIQFRHKLWTRRNDLSHLTRRIWTLLNKNEIMVFMLPPEEEDNDPIEYARTMMDHFGVVKDAVVSASRIWLPTQLIAGVHHIRGLRDILSQSDRPPCFGMRHLLIRLRNGWRNLQKIDYDIGPNDILLHGVPEASDANLITCLIRTANLIDFVQSDMFLVRLVARNSGVYIEEDMFSVKRVTERNSPCYYSHPFQRHMSENCAPELPRPLLVRFTNNDVKETLASVLRKQNDLYERAPCVFATLRREIQANCPGRIEKSRRRYDSNRSYCKCIRWEFEKWKRMSTGGYTLYKSCCVRISSDEALALHLRSVRARLRQIVRGAEMTQQERPYMLHYLRNM